MLGQSGFGDDIHGASFNYYCMFNFLISGSLVFHSNQCQLCTTLEFMQLTKRTHFITFYTATDQIWSKFNIIYILIIHYLNIEVVNVSPQN